MRVHYQAFLITALAAAAFFAASAFDAASTSTRTVTATVVGDSAAYLAVAANGSSPHAGFVSVSGGKMSVSFGSGVATGTGVNPDGTYYWDDLLNVTNQGTKTVNVQVNATSTTGTVKVCVKTAGGQMDNSCYVANSAVFSLAVGNKLSLGLMAQATGLNSGQTVSGTIQIDANR
jgi:hypothetical protein